MATVGIRELKDRLSAYVARARRGEVVTITDRGVPVARLMPPESDGLEGLRQLARQVDSGWTGGKPEGWPGRSRTPLPQDASAAGAIVEERDRV